MPSQLTITQLQNNTALQRTTTAPRGVLHFRQCRQQPSSSPSTFRRRRQQRLPSSSTFDVVITCDQPSTSLFQLTFDVVSLHRQPSSSTFVVRPSSSNCVVQPVVVVRSQPFVVVVHLSSSFDVSFRFVFAVLLSTYPRIRGQTVPLHCSTAALQRYEPTHCPLSVLCE